ncbi:helix-turn-helix domain-containing protein [Hymenobacter sp. NST-14]|nr:helix-turn-helix domain-containing protein [Hymenobacter piscis]
MLERIRELLAQRELSSTQFADAIGVSRPVVSHILSGRNKPSLEVVQKIVAAYPDLSLAWLLSGTGPMTAPVAPVTVSASAPVPVLRPAPAPVAAPASEQPLPKPQDVPGPTEPRNPAATATSRVAGPSAGASTAPEGQHPAETPLAGPPAPVLPLPHQPAPTAPAATQAAASPLEEPRAEIQPAGVDMAQALATPGKRIRRIVIFYQDGTFADYQPESAS